MTDDCCHIWVSIAKSTDPSVDSGIGWPLFGLVFFVSFCVCRICPMIPAYTIMTMKCLSFASYAFLCKYKTLHWSRLATRQRVHYALKGLTFVYDKGMDQWSSLVVSPSSGSPITLRINQSINQFYFHSKKLQRERRAVGKAAHLRFDGAPDPHSSGTQRNTVTQTKVITDIKTHISILIWQIKLTQENKFYSHVLFKLTFPKVALGKVLQYQLPLSKNNLLL